MDAQLQERITKKIKECLRKGNRLFGSRARLNKFTVSRKLRKWGVAGWNPTDQYYMRVSQEGLQNDPEYVINEVIPHETAHVIAYWLAHNDMEHGDFGHGDGWRTIAKALGSDGSTNGKGEIPRYKYRAQDGEIVNLNRKQHDYLQKEFKVLRSPSGARITAAGYMGENQ